MVILQRNGLTLTKKIAAQAFANYVYDKNPLSTQTKENFDLLFEKLK